MAKTLLRAAFAGEDIPVVDEVAWLEGVSPGFVKKQIASGRIVIMQRDGKPPVGIGEGLRTKINANIGSSAELFDRNDEVEKAIAAEKYGADTITDLSMGGLIDEIRISILEATSTPLTTVPIYQTVAKMGSIAAPSKADIIDTIRSHVDGGISSVVIHAAITFEMLEALKVKKRIMGMVSRGGSFTSAWMLQNGEENPFLSQFEVICRILQKKDAVLSLGNTMRSGCIDDFMDEPSKMELEMNADLARRANELGVQVIIEGMGGHVSPDRIADYVQVYKKTTGFRPLFVAGPLPTDIGVGYDHISGSVGGALASGFGADYLCYITPSEHLALPGPAQVREGVVAFKIAAHIGDLMKYGVGQRDRILARCRRAMDWDGQFKAAIDGDRAREIHRKNRTGACSMCGKYCAIQIMERYLK